jgi:hypothetical protein
MHTNNYQYGLKKHWNDLQKTWNKYMKLCDNGDKDDKDNNSDNSNNSNNGDGDYNWKKCRITASITALEQEISELTSYMEHGENKDDKNTNKKMNDIMSAVMPLMTYMWFKDIDLTSENNHDSLFSSES